MDYLALYAGGGPLPTPFIDSTGWAPGRYVVFHAEDATLRHLNAVYHISDDGGLAMPNVTSVYHRNLRIRANFARDRFRIYPHNFTIKPGSLLGQTALRCSAHGYESAKADIAAPRGFGKFSTPVDASTIHFEVVDTEKEAIQRFRNYETPGGPPPYVDSVGWETGSCVVFHTRDPNQQQRNGVYEIKDEKATSKDNDYHISVDRARDVFVFYQGNKGPSLVRNEKGYKASQVVDSKQFWNDLTAHNITLDAHFDIVGTLDEADALFTKYDNQPLPPPKDSVAVMFISARYKVFDGVYEISSKTKRFSRQIRGRASNAKKIKIAGFFLSNQDRDLHVFYDTHDSLWHPARKTTEGVMEMAPTHRMPTILNQLDYVDENTKVFDARATRKKEMPANYWTGDGFLPLLKICGESPLGSFRQQVHIKIYSTVVTNRPAVTKGKKPQYDFPTKIGEMAYDIEPVTKIINTKFKEIFGEDLGLTEDKTGSKGSFSEQLYENMFGKKKENQRKKAAPYGLVFSSRSNYNVTQRNETRVWFYILFTYASWRDGVKSADRIS